MSEGGSLKGPSRSEELEATWGERVSRQQVSGLSIREFCRREELKESAFYFWKRELKRRAGEHQSSHEVAAVCSGNPRAKSARTD